MNETNYTEYKTMKIKNVIISLEGNIGSGKSTLLKFLEEALCKDKKIIFLQ